MSVTCPLCGMENDTGREVCAACGAMLSPAPVQPVRADAVPKPGAPQKPAAKPTARPGEVRLRNPIDDPWFADDAPKGAAEAAPRQPKQVVEAQGATGPPTVQAAAQEEAPPAPGGQTPSPEAPGEQVEEALPGLEAGAPYTGWPPAWQSPYGQSPYGQQAPQQLAQPPYPWGPWMYGAPGAPPYAPQPFVPPYPSYPGYPPPHAFFGYPSQCPYMGGYGYGQPYPAYPPPHAAPAYQAPSYGSPYPAPYPDAFAGYAPQSARGPRKKRSLGLIIGIIILLLAIAGGVTAAFLLTSSGSASYKLGDGTVTGANIEFRGVTLKQDGKTLTLSGTYDNTSKREGEVTATVQALTGGAEQLIAFTVPVVPGSGKRFSQNKTESIKLSGATLGPLLFSSSGSFDSTGSDTGSDSGTDGTLTPETSPGTSPSVNDNLNQETLPDSTGTTYPGYPGTIPSFPY